MSREHVQDLALQHRSRQHPVQQVLTVERTDEHMRIPQAKLCGDVVPDPSGRRRRIGMHADTWEKLAEPRELAVFGSEVMPPLADTVRLVHRHEGDSA